MEYLQYPLFPKSMATPASNFAKGAAASRARDAASVGLIGVTAGFLLDIFWNVWPRDPPLFGRRIQNAPARSLLACAGYTLATSILVNWRLFHPLHPCHASLLAELIGDGLFLGPCHFGILVGHWLGFRVRLKFTERFVARMHGARLIDARAVLRQHLPAQDVLQQLETTDSPESLSAWYARWAWWQTYCCVMERRLGIIVPWHGIAAMELLAPLEQVMGWGRVSTLKPDQVGSVMRRLGQCGVPVQEEEVTAALRLAFVVHVPLEPPEIVGGAKFVQQVLDFYVPGGETDYVNRSTMLACLKAAERLPHRSQWLSPSLLAIVRASLDIGMDVPTVVVEYIVGVALPEDAGEATQVARVLLPDDWLLPKGSSPLIPWMQKLASGVTRSEHCC